MAKGKPAVSKAVVAGNRGKKNAAAVALGRRRVELMSSAEHKAMSAAGGLSRAKKLTAEKRQEIGRKGAAARWGKK